MGATKRKLPVMLFDIMDTVVVDPFYSHMAPFFGLTFKELLAAKHPTAWLQFERGEVGEDEFYSIFFADGRPCDGKGLRECMVAAYEYIPGMEALLAELTGRGYELHACSNYTTWYRQIDNKLQLSKYLDWTFMSCEGPMKGFRKPQMDCFTVTVEHLGVPADNLLFVDDREANVEAAKAAGLDAIHFQGTELLTKQLQQRGLL